MNSESDPLSVSESDPLLVSESDPLSVSVPKPASAQIAIGIALYLKQYTRRMRSSDEINPLHARVWVQD